MTGYTLELFYKDGRPDGLVTAEIFGWTGHLLRMPRIRLKEIEERPEARYTGAYLLLSEEAGRNQVYVGEADSLWWRLRDHEAKKDWWTHAILITSAANKLNKAHARYLEARLHEEAVKVGYSELKNSQRPNRPSLSEAEVANMEAFLAQVLMALPALRVDVFVERVRPQVAQVIVEPIATAIAIPAETSISRFKLERQKSGVCAFATLRDGEFIVEEGSTARPAEENQSGYRALHLNLAHTGILVPDGEVSRFTKNFVFSSLSAAASIVMGRSANGTVEWRTIDNLKTYKEWEAAQIGASSAGDQ